MCQTEQFIYGGNHGFIVKNSPSQLRGSAKMRGNWVRSWPPSRPTPYERTQPMETVEEVE